jgi:hypothetical protein
VLCLYKLVESYAKHYLKVALGDKEAVTDDVGGRNKEN